MKVCEILGQEAPYRIDWLAEVNFIGVMLDVWCEREGVGKESLEGFEELVKGEFEGSLKHGVERAMEKGEECRVPIIYEQREDGSGYWSVKWLKEHDTEGKCMFSYNNMLSYLYRVVGSILLDGRRAVLEVGDDSLIDYFCRVKILMKKMGYPFELIVRGEKINKAVTSEIVQRYYLGGKRDSNTSIEDKKRLLEEYGYFVGGFYLLAERTKGRGESRAQKWQDTLQSQEILDERIKLVRLVGVNGSNLCVEEFPKLQTYAAQVKMFRELPEEHRVVVRECLRKEIKPIKSSYGLYNIAFEEGVSCMKEPYLLGKLDKNALVEGFPVWLGEEERFDPNGDAIYKEVNEVEYIKIVLKQRGFQFDEKLYDKIYNLKEGEMWYEKEIEGVSAMSVGKFVTPEWLVQGTEERGVGILYEEMSEGVNKARKTGESYNAFTEVEEESEEELLEPETEPSYVSNQIVDDEDFI